MAKYLLVSFDLNMTQKVDPTTNMEQDILSSGPITWHGIEEESDTAYQGNSYFDASTTYHPDTRTFTHHYVYHIVLGDDSVAKALNDNSMLLDRTIGFSSCEKSYRGCCRLLASSIMQQIASFLITFCDAQLADGGRFETSLMTKDPSVKNQIMVSGDDRIYIKLTGNKEGEEPKTFETEMDYGWFLLHSFMTAEIPEKCRTTLGLREPKTKEELEKEMNPTDIDTSDMSFEDELVDEIMEVTEE